MLLSVYYLQDNAVFDLNFKPGNFRRRKDGQVDTKGFKDPDLVPDSPKTLSTAKRWQSFSKKWASAADIYAAQRTVIYVLTKTREESHRIWDLRAIKAAQAGADGSDGFQRMLLDSLKPNVEVQQPMALWLLRGLSICWPAVWIQFWNLAAGVTWPRP